MQSAPLLEIERRMQLDIARLAPEFAAYSGLEARLAPAAFHRPALLGFFLKFELERLWLSARRVSHALATAAAARVAAQAILAERDALSPADFAALPGWVPVMAAEAAPPGARITAHFPLPEAELARLRGCWGLLGTAEALMETGGDIRLARDPVSALNGYGCSHRPRPWAVTFASSTASSSSERGYAAADAARLRTTASLLRGEPRERAIRRSLETVRQGIARNFGLAPGSAVVLAASGTDTELFALALRHLGGAADRPICNILIAPEETGRGVPMAARGLHFAVDTALGHDVTFQAPVAGFRPDTALVNISLRGADGALREVAQIEAEIEAAVRDALAAGRRVILHALDLSKTGLLAPSPDFLRRLRAEQGDAVDLVVDACQARLSPASLRHYLALDAVVLITGSKFLTGPPFAGAAILPPAIAARLATGTLPEGLAAYFGRHEFPPRCHAARLLPAVGNVGLALRWHAALAELRAFLRTPAERRLAILQGFEACVRREIARYPALALIEPPPVARGAADEAWERCPTIFTFSLRGPHAPQRCLTPEEARRVYLWLNTDLSELLPAAAAVAARICHIGQPVPLAQPGLPEKQGALRVSAGARLISGEPSHRGLGPVARIAREFADLATVFQKIDLILRHWDFLCSADPAPCYRPQGYSLAGTHERFPVA